MKESSGQIFRIYTRAVIFDATKKHVLFIKKNTNQKIGSGAWLLPGGTVEFGEDTETALIREVQEETNLKISSLELLTTKKMVIDGTHWIGLYYLGKVFDENDVKNLETAKHETVQFVNLEDMPDLRDYTIVQSAKNMKKNLLMVIMGLPGTGKTTLGRKLAEELALPFISKDDIKELLFDSLGWEDRAWSKKIGGSSYDVLYYIAESILKVGRPLIIETNFDSKFASKKIVDLKEKYNLDSFQIRCHTDGAVLFERFKKRALSTERHPGHIDSENLEEWRPILLKGKIDALDIGGEFFDVDTTDFDTIDYKKLLGAIKSALGNE